MKQLSPRKALRIEEGLSLRSHGRGVRSQIASSGDQQEGRSLCTLPMLELPCSCFQTLDGVKIAIFTQEQFAQLRQ